MTIKELQHKIERTKKQIEAIIEKHGPNPGNKYSYYGGYDLGYLEGKLAVYEDWLDELDYQS